MSKETPWMILKIERNLERRQLGVIMARHQPHAILKAGVQWPKEADTSRPQSGFTAIPVLGKRR